MNEKWRIFLVERPGDASEVFDLCRSLGEPKDLTSD